MHSCTLGCGNTLTHSVIKTYAHHTCSFLPLPPSLSLSFPSTLSPLLTPALSSLLFFSPVSLYLPPMADSGRATSSKTRRLQNVGQPLVLSYRLETAVCACGPLALRVATQAGVSGPCRQAARFPRSVPNTRALLLLSFPGRQAEEQGCMRIPVL